MNDLLKRPLNLNKIEFWAATTIYTFAILLLLGKVSNSNEVEIWTPYRYMFNNYHLHYSYSKYYFFPQVFRYSAYYGAFLFWNFVIIPKLLERRQVAWNIILGIALILLLWFVFGATDTWLKGYLFYHKSQDYVYNLVFKMDFLYALWVGMMLTFYSIIKATAQYLLQNINIIQQKYQILTYDGIVAIVCWMIALFLLALVDAPLEVISLTAVVGPVSIGLYLLSFYSIIPQVIESKKGFFAFLWRIAIIVVAVAIVIGFLTALIFDQKDPVLIIGSFNAAFQIVVFAPFIWIVYRRKLASTQEITTLKTALGKSTANLDFLRSQINPHFLFNALNTLYGTALQENAERTGEGIQRLGDMMRFMLQENMQEKILLVREIDYLNNYIALQKLRTQSSPDIVIVVQIAEHVDSLQIAPMLLIPFVENAFKHGISLREPSHINITLQTKDNKLYFDVHNSMHKKMDNDTEKHIGGIGLENVKQRLKLLYPGRHELVVRESAKDFFIHLTIQLLP